MSHIPELSARLHYLSLWQKLDERILTLNALGYSFGEIAEQAGVSETMVGYRIWRNTL